MLSTVKRGKCFYCYGSVRGRAIVWKGSTAEILFHPKCANDLLLRLARDVWGESCGEPTFEETRR